MEGTGNRSGERRGWDAANQHRNAQLRFDDTIGRLPVVVPRGIVRCVFAPTLSCSEDPAGCAATRLGSYGANGLLPTEYGRGPVTEERGAFVPQKP
jgi:hypothetical protein